MDFDWKGMLRGIAPVIAGVAGGPQVGVAVKFLGDKLMGKPDATELEVAAKLQGATGEEIVKLRSLDNEFKLEMERIGFNYEELEQKNVTSRHGSDMTSDSWLSKNIRPLALAYLTIITTGLAIWTIGWMPADKMPILQAWISLITALLLTVYGFYFGSRGLEKLMAIFKNGGK